MKESNPYLASERVGRLMAKYAVPCVISLLVGALYNIVDQIFISIFACVNKACFIFSMPWARRHRLRSCP